jgi:hypothetical protein
MSLMCLLKSAMAFVLDTKSYIKLISTFWQPLQHGFLASICAIFFTQPQIDISLSLLSQQFLVQFGTFVLASICQRGPPAWDQCFLWFTSLSVE